MGLASDVPLALALVVAPPPVTIIWRMWSSMLDDKGLTRADLLVFRLSDRVE